MSIEIRHGLLNQQVNDTQSDKQPKALDEASDSASKESPESSSAVVLSGQAQLLHKIEAQLSKTPEVDMAKVEMVRHKLLTDGVDILSDDPNIAGKSALSIADKIIGLDNES